MHPSESDARAAGSATTAPAGDADLPTRRLTGEAKLKDIQHERLFQLSVDDGTRSFPPLKTEVEKDARRPPRRADRAARRGADRACTDQSDDRAPEACRCGSLAGGCAIAVAVLVVALLALAGA